MNLPQSPYPRSKAVKGIRWLTEPMPYPAGNYGDAWSCTWADDDLVYSTGDDITVNQNTLCNLGLFQVEGRPPLHKVTLINPMSAYGGRGEWDPIDSWKANGLICVDGVLYMTVSQHSTAEGYGDLVQRTYDASIIKSVDHGKTWSPKRRLPTFMSPRFSTPYFVQFGRNYDGAMDDYVYAVSGTSWNNGNYLTLGRVRRDLIGRLDGCDWEMFAGMEPGGNPRWQPWRLYVHWAETPVFKFRNFTSMTGMHYVPAIDRFLLPQWAYVDLDGNDPWRQTFLHLYEAPKPWGPWSLVHVEEDFGNAWYNPCLPSKWFDDGGRRMWMVSGGDFMALRAKNWQDCTFCVRQLELIL